MKARRILVIAIGAISLLAGSCASLPPMAQQSRPGAQQGALGQSVSIQTADGMASALFFAPSEPGSYPAVVLFPDASGLRPAFSNIGQRLAQAGYNVLIPNEFYRSTSFDGSAENAAELLPPSETFRRGMEWRTLATDAAVISDTRAYLAWLGTLPGVDHSAKVGVGGFNVGASHAFIAARAMPYKIAAVAVAHPSAIATTRDTSPHLFVAQSNAAYLVQLAAPDDEREPQDRPDLLAAFANAGLSGEVTVTPADQGFAIPDQAGFDPAAEEAFFQAMLTLFGEKLK